MKPISSTAGRWMLLLACVTVSVACGDEIEPTPICDPPAPMVTPPNAVVRPGESVTYTASGADLSLCNGTRITNPTFRWVSSNPRVATIDSLTGIATARDTGQTTVIARVREDPNMQGAAAIVVRP